MVITVLKWERGIEITNGYLRGVTSEVSKTKPVNDTELQSLLLDEATLNSQEQKHKAHLNVPRL